MNRHKNHKIIQIKILIIDIAPYFAEYLLQVFEANYSDVFISNMINTLSMYHY